MKSDSEKEMQDISQIIHCRLSEVARLQASISESVHLDEDSIGAFVEGSLDEREQVPVVTHLNSCEACRVLSVRLIRLESLLAEDETELTEAGPSRLHQFFSDLASRVIPSPGEDAVFAYQNPDEEAKTSKKKSPDKPEEQS